MAYLLIVPALLLSIATAAGQPRLFTDALPKEEFADRRSRLMDRLGDDVLVVQGAAETPNYERFRQANQFFYLTGVEVPRAILVMDGRAKTTTLFLMPRNERMERSEGPVLTPGEEAARLTGIDRVVPREEFAATAKALAGRTVYTTFRGETRSASAPDRQEAHAAARKADPWDGAMSREELFRSRLAAAAPGVSFKDVDAILDEMRLIKSPREIELVRRATRIAGEGIMEAMRSAQPGMYEYELAAIVDYVFRKHGSQGVGYYPLVAAGTNAAWPHYHALETKIASGDLVLLDYAPDYRYYTSDVTRMFPIDGTFTPAQKELYTVYLRLYQALMTSIRPGRAQDILKEVVGKMDAVMATFAFTDPRHREAATRFVDGYRRRAEAPPAEGRRGGSLGHMVGMEVHDVTVPFEELKPGMIFTIEPALTMPEERVYIRLEDVILITKEGYENLSAFVPMEVAEIEKLMAEPGLGEKPSGSPR